MQVVLHIATAMSMLLTSFGQRGGVLERAMELTWLEYPTIIANNGPAAKTISISSQRRVVIWEERSSRQQR
jgi:hypothetical protein